MQFYDYYFLPHLSLLRVTNVDRQTEPPPDISSEGGGFVPINVLYIVIILVIAKMQLFIQDHPIVLIINR